MTRSPLFYPLNRGKDGEAGGIADLQTDVMRFMAILALCLVAIFALVQSIPLSPREAPPQAAPEPEPAPQVVERPQPVEQPQPEPVEETVREIVLTRPQPQPQLQQAAEPEAPAPLAADPEPIVPAPAEPEIADEGFTLRFEDELALTRLVARNDVGLYAIQPDQSYRMNVNRGQMSFWPASTPNQFHEMDIATVPQAVLDAFRRREGSTSQSLQWGVTLPVATSRQLERFLREETGGALIIEASGDLRLER